MGTLDLYVDGFPHGTDEGYRMGCQSNGACPRDEDGLQSCKQAAIRLKSDWRYSLMVKQGASELEAARALGAPAAKVSPNVHAEPEPVAEERIVFDDERSVRPAPHVAFSPAQEKAAGPKPRPVRNPAETVVPLAPEALTDVAVDPDKPKFGKLALDDPAFPHGTVSGYSRGCRVKNYQCPGDENGQTCPAAANEYQAERKRIQKAAKALVAPPVEEVPAVAEPIEVELGENGSVSFVDAAYAATGPGPEVSALELITAERDELLAKLTAANDQTKLMSDSFDADSALIQAQRVEIEQLRGVVNYSYRWFVFQQDREWAVTLRDGSGALSGMFRMFDTREAAVSYALIHSGEVTQDA
ncbi:hypothetical protein [Subtercola sp. YIM 133946]|uniref:hypothetical protein n=1 Tax=Subtercola sp. YIM 133946 TaxID=3118909 RepID=UPI002F922457